MFGFSKLVYKFILMRAKIQVLHFFEKYTVIQYCPKLLFIVINNLIMGISTKNFTSFWKNPTRLFQKKGRFGTMPLS